MHHIFYVVNRVGRATGVCIIFLNSSPSQDGNGTGLDGSTKSISISISIARPTIYPRKYPWMQNNIYIHIHRVSEYSWIIHIHAIYSLRPILRDSNLWRT